MIITYHGVVVFDISRQTFDVIYCAVATAWIIFGSIIIFKAMRGES